MMFAVVGLGNLGSGIASRLADTGHEVVGMDPSAEARESWAATGSAAVADLADLPWPDVSAVFVVVLLTSQVEDTLVRLRELVGDDGTERAVYVVSTLGADAARRLSASTTPTMRIIESPISGGGAGARDGLLSVMLGGPVSGDDVKLFESTIATNVTVFGDYGEPAIAKLLNNAAMAAHARILADILELAEGLGLGAGRLYQILLHASGTSRAAVKFRDLRAPTLDKDVRLLLSSIPASRDAGLFGELLPRLDGLADHMAAARSLLDAELG
ncbi:MAG TPA: NAD(P)-binding domain-containing protein [Amycolatopsis sp.]|nr:NAD(P)-binding domain-containing protein [Amycolatopsis sp.]